MYIGMGQGTCKKTRPYPARAYTTLVVLVKTMDGKILNIFDDKIVNIICEKIVNIMDDKILTS